MAAELTMRLSLAAMLCFGIGGGGVYGVRSTTAPNGGLGLVSLYNVSAPAEMEKAARALGGTGSMKFDFPSLNPAAAYADVVAKLKSGELSKPIDMGRSFTPTPFAPFTGVYLKTYETGPLYVPRR
jgi:hypothetical protein